MELRDAKALLTVYNMWRRGDESLTQPDPTEIGVAIDTVLAEVDARLVRDMMVRAKLDWFARGKKSCEGRMSESLSMLEGETDPDLVARHATDVANQRFEIGKAELEMACLRWALGE